MPQWLMGLSLHKKLELFAVLLLIPFCFGGLWNGNAGNVAGAIIASVFFFLSFLTPEKHRYSCYARALTAMGPGLVIWWIVSFNPTYASYWSFPFMLFLYFQLNLCRAITANLVFVGGLTLILTQYLDAPMLARFIAAHALANGFAIFFAHDRQVNEDRLKQLATTDSLTGLYNRREAMRSLQYALDIKSRYGQSSTLMIIDLDHFKKINDHNGHIKGDEVLVTFSRLMKDRVRSSDLLARLGGEEFLLLLRHTGLRQAGELAQQLIQCCREHPFDIAQAVTISIGVAECEDGESLATWLKAADDALYQAKQEGRDRLSYAPERKPARQVA
ncbi:hypothetical protein BTA51_12760 [Hahella sp. CCB-MM4]|uniref:GGDEF domain-containing protein n=1 Tax=Hahella sp. (strain CCB-MM4) TaxID=1926491 RepID=UPI000B9AF184|nr:GGDEF domain-containing protein [Hahella sp. CCB-MM4]OZG72842.1 hypothetical protein BTA51_12760 [Hahella sp. CCB-MM4]